MFTMNCSFSVTQFLKKKRTRIQGMALRTGAGLYQLKRIEEPPRFIGRVTYMSARVEDGDSNSAEE